MKIKAHIRIGFDKKTRNYKLEATVNPSSTPIRRGNGTDLPTVAFAVMFDVPDVMFRQAEQVIATMTIPESQARIVADVTEPETTP
jgi:hypothetical protein